jgi:nucleoside-diphosphate-sugar epimerase
MPIAAAGTSPTVLITGVGGFIGRAMVPKLVAAGARVVGTDLAETLTLDGLAAYRRLDVTSADMAVVLGSFGPVDTVIHAGGISGYMVSKDPAHIFAVNLAGTSRLLEFARLAGVSRVILCSTIMLYGPDAEGRTVTEDDYPTPVSLYGASKLGIEALANGYAGQCGLDVVALRFTHVYGPGRTTECFVRELVRAAVEGKPCHIPQPRTGVRQYIHIDDVCASILACCWPKAASTRRVFNISGGEMHTLGELHGLVEDVVGPVAVTFDDRNDVRAYRIPRLSIALAERELFYVPQVKLRDGITGLARQFGVPVA